MVQPVGLSSALAEIGSIEQFIDGGFASALAAASTPSVTIVQQPPASEPSVPTAFAVEGMAGQPQPAAVAFNSPLNTASDAQGATGDGLGAMAAALAKGFIGVPYLWGGDSPSGFDCSGLVQYVYRELGIDLPRTSQEQATVGIPVASLADAQPGDLVFFPGVDGTPMKPGHVGIYIGDGEMVDAPYSGSTVQVQPVGDPVEIRRVIQAQPPNDGPLPTGQFLPSDGSQSQYGQLFAAATKQYGLPPGLLKAMAQVESSMNPDVVSNAGAEGLMQIMPGVAHSLGIDPFDPSQAIPAAASLMSSYLRTYGSLQLALAAYNAGPAAVDKYGAVPPYQQTQDYIINVISLMEQQHASGS